MAPALDAEAMQRIRRRLSHLHPVLEEMRIELVDDVPTNRAGKRRWITREE